MKEYDLLNCVTRIDPELMVQTDCVIRPPKVKYNKSTALRKIGLRYKMQMIETKANASTSWRNHRVTTSDEFRYFVADNAPVPQLEVTTAQSDNTFECFNDELLHSAPTHPAPKHLVRLHKIAAMVMLFISLLAGATACHKPQPEPTKTRVIEWDWQSALPTKDSVKYYADQPDVKNVILKLRDNDYTPTGFAKHNFKRARDSLDTRFAIDREKIIGEGKIYLSHDTQKDQIEDDDSLYFVMNGFVFVRYGYNKSQSYQ